MLVVLSMSRKNRRVNRNTQRRDRLRSIFLTVLVCAMIVSFLAIDGYKFVPRFQYWWRNREIKREYVMAVEEVRQEQRRLKAEIDKLENNTLTQERLAREMGYIKPGEIVYKFVP